MSHDKNSDYLFNPKEKNSTIKFFSRILSNSPIEFSILRMFFLFVSLLDPSS